MNRMKNKLFIGQKQQLSLNQRLTQAIKILSLSYDEVLDLIKKEAVENPVLSIDSTEFKPSSYQKSKSAASPTREGEDVDFLDTVIADKLGALDVLKAELSFLSLNQRELAIAKTLCDNLDEAGYIDKNDLELIAENLGVDREEIMPVLKELRKLKPAGIFAFNLKDSLLLQLRRREPRNLIAEKILLSCLNLLLRRDMGSIAAKLGVDPGDIEEAIVVIKGLNPRPLSLINSYMDVNYIQPDLKLYFDEGGRPIVLVDESFMSSMRYEPYYEGLILDKTADEETRSYVRKQFARLKLLREALEKRSITLKRVATCIFERQGLGFFDKDVSLNVLTLKMIAHELGLHESTVSRTIRAKYVDTPLGIYELKFFLQKGLKNKNEEAVSRARIQALLKALIEGEDGAKPLSDKALAEKLAENNILISRRGVCKYREELGFPSSAKRKRRH